MAYLTDEEIDQRILAQGQTFDRQPASGGLAQIGQATNIRRPDWMPPEVTETPESAERTLGGTLSDVGVSLGKGVVGTGQAAIGLADIVTPGQLGKGLENVGVDLGAAQDYLDEKYSPAQQAAFKKVEDVKGFLPTLGAMVQNPSTIVHSVVESLPAIAGGGLVGRGALALAPRIGGLAAGAIGEGAITAGQTSEGIRAQADDREITGKQSLMALGAGAGTGLIGGLSGKIAGKIAGKLGINLADVDTFAATGKLGDAAKKLSGKGKFTDNVAARIVAGGVSEGVFEELPQSVQEQVWMNAATGKDLKEGLGEAAAAGLLAGTAMGGGMNVFTSSEMQNFTDDEKQQINNEIQNITSAEQAATTPEEQANIQAQKEQVVDAIHQRQQEVDLQQGVAKSEDEIRSDRQALYDQWWALPTEKSAQESAEAILAQKPLADIEQAQMDRQSQIDQTYLPAEEEVDRINAYRLQEAQQTGEPDPATERTVPFEERLPRENQRVIDELESEEALTTQPDVIPAVEQVEQTGEEVVPVEEAAIPETPLTEPEQVIQDQNAIQEDFQAREALISDMESELEENKIEQSQLGVNDPMREELQYRAEELQGQIQDGNRELLVDRLSAGPDAQFETRSDTEPGQGIALPEIQKMYKGQDVLQADDGTISVRFKNGSGATIQNIQDAGNGFVQMAIDTGQMSKAGKILGVTTGNNILLDSEFADNATLWHENKHVLDNLGMITEQDNSLLNKEFNKLRKSGKLNFGLSTHEDPKQAMEENRANMFAQIMSERTEYRDTALGKVIQRVMDFFKNLFSLGQQTVGGLAREVESGKIYDRDTNQKQQTDPMFQVQDLSKPEQKISDDVYRDVYEQQSSMVENLNQNIKKTGRSINRGMNKYLGMISTNLKKINPMLEAKVRKLGFDTTQAIKTDLETAKPLLDALKEMKRRSPQDLSAWHWARVNGDAGKINQITKKYGITEDYRAVRESLNRIRQDAEAVGYNIGFIDEYWPRVLKDRDGFLQATQELSNEPVFSRALKAQADKLGVTVDALDDGLKADIISNIVLGRPSGIGGPGNIRQRYFEEVPPELAKFYMDSDAALMNYVYSMNKKIEARKFFGKVPERIANVKKDKRTKETRLANLTALESNLVADGQDTTVVKEQISGLQDDIQIAQNELDKYGSQDDFKENIGSYVMDLMIREKKNPGTGVKPNDEQALRDILTARFNEKGTTGLANVYKNLSYIDTMGSPVSAITQLGDLAWAVYVGGLTPRGIANSVKNIGKALLGKSDITREDIGITRIAQEFADGDTLSNAVSKIFKIVGIEKLDKIGKEALINNSFDNYRAKAERATKSEVEMKRFKTELEPIFGNKSEKVINDLLDSNVAMQSDDVKLLVYSRLLDFQPADLSETPEAYLNAGNGRLFYMLKMFTLKQFDVFRREVWHNIKTGERDKVLQGLGNATRLMAILSLANAGADELKDWLLGKDVKFEDHVIENLLTLGGASRYLRMQTTREGIGSGLAGQILPPFKFIDAISKDVTNDTRDGLRSVDSIPVGGKLYYWHLGRGKELRKSVEEKDWGKENKEFRKFNKEFEESDDKRLFLRSNYETFKQKKLYDNFSKALRGNKKTIAKLKDIEQTPNVRRRLGQLEQQRKDLIMKYFEMKNNFG